MWLFFHTDTFSSLLPTTEKSVEEKLGLLFDVVPQIDFMETDTTIAKSIVAQNVQVYYLRKIGRSLHRCIYMVLLALVHKVKRLKVEPENLAQSASEYCKGISDAVEIVETESQVRNKKRTLWQPCFPVRYLIFCVILVPGNTLFRWSRRDSSVETACYNSQKLVFALKFWRISLFVDDHYLQCCIPEYQLLLIQS